MKLIVIIVQDADASRLRDAFSLNSVPFTKLASTSGFLRRGLCTFASGITDDRVDAVKRMIEQNFRKRPAPIPSYRRKGWLKTDLLRRRGSASFRGKAAEPLALK